MYKKLIKKNIKKDTQKVDYYRGDRVIKVSRMALLWVYTDHM